MASADDTIIPQDAIAKLSIQQKSILQHLWRLYLEDKQNQARPGFPAGCKTADTFGPVYRTKGPRSDQASMSRALARLEARGLVLRQNICRGSPGRGEYRRTADDPKSVRTHNVSFTDLGKVVAKWLTSGVAKMLTI